jgi:hypothetical protein
MSRRSAGTAPTALKASRKTIKLQAKMAGPAVAEPATRQASNLIRITV